MIHNDILARGERCYRVEIERDGDMGRPWEEHDGYGVIRGADVRAREGKRAGERPMGSHYYYNVAATTALAKRDGWGLTADAVLELESKLKRAPTRGEIVAAAVEADYQHCLGWVNNEWYWCGVIVTCLETGESDSLWGIESCAEDYIGQVANDMIDVLEAHAVAEDTEREHWAQRDVLTT